MEGSRLKCGLALSKFYWLNGGTANAEYRFCFEWISWLVMARGNDFDWHRCWLFEGDAWWATEMPECKTKKTRFTNDGDTECLSCASCD